MANASMVSEIVEMGLGFDIPDIQNALLVTGNTSSAAALDYLLNSGAAASGHASPPPASTSRNDATTTNINQLKSELQKFKITNVSENAMKDALSKNNGNVKKAAEFIVKQQSTSSSQQPRRQSQAQTAPSQPATSTTQGQQRTSVKRTSIADNKGTMASAANVPTSTSTTSTAATTSAAVTTNITNREDAERMKTKLLQEAEMKRKQQQQEQKERELQLKKQEEEFLREEKKKEIQKIENQKKVLENRNRIAAKKKQAESERKQKLLEWHKKHEKYDAADKAVHDEMTQNRSKAEQHLDTPEKAVQCLFERYGEDLARESLWMIQKILQNIADNPNDPKYRRFNLDNRKIHTRIETPLGAMRFLELVGFTVIQEQPSEPLSTADKVSRYAILNDKQFDLSKVQKALKLLEKYLTTKETLVAPILRKMEQEMNTPEKDTLQIGLSAEELYCAVITIHDIIRNLTISPMSEHLRYVNIDDVVFKQRVGKFEQMIKMMEEIGYKLKDSPRGRHLVYEFDNNCGVPITSSVHPQIRLLHGVTIDLNNAAKRILPQTAIAVAIANLRKTHSGDPGKQANLEKVLSILEKALERIIEQPLDMTYQNISLDKIKAKYPNVTGVVSLLKLLGFDRSHKNELAQSDQDKQVKNIEQIYQLNVNDFDLLRLRRDILVQLLHH